MDKYTIKTPQDVNIEEEIVIKKSRFISKIWYISSKEEADKIIEEQKEMYSDARHVVYAYRLENVGKYTDDKEPQGTAGKPIYSLLEKENISENDVQFKIKDAINKEQERVEDLKELGYKIYNRDSSNDMYKIENTTEFYLTGHTLYIIYAYGNETFTSEMDLVIL